MARIRVPLVHDGTSYHVDLPTYQMVPGTCQPIKPGLLTADGPAPAAAVADVLALGPTVAAEVPDVFLAGPSRQFDALHLRTSYPGWAGRHPGALPDALERL